MKRSHVYANWNEIYIASNAHPDTWYPEGMPEGLERRIATSVYFPPKKGVKRVRVIQPDPRVLLGGFLPH